MQRDGVAGLRPLWESWSCRLNDLQDDPKVSRLIHSRAGRCVRSQPVLAVALLLFAALALLPVGLFLAFALVTLAASAAGFVAVEVLLLFAGGLSLLGVLMGLAIFSVVASLVFNAAYAVLFNVLPSLAELSKGQKTEAQKAQ